MNDNSHSFAIHKSTLELVQGDITRQDTDAIVNAANSGLLGGGGVDGAIHKTGGPDILEECKRIKALTGGCPAGSAVITKAGLLKAKYVIHAVGPIWRGGHQDESTVLASAYRACLLLADEHDLLSIAFPSISTGAYGYPIAEAAHVALSVIDDWCRENHRPGLIRFVLFDPFSLDTYGQIAQSVACAVN